MSFIDVQSGIALFTSQFVKSSTSLEFFIVLFGITAKFHPREKYSPRFSDERCGEATLRWFVFNCNSIIFGRITNVPPEPRVLVGWKKIPNFFSLATPRTIQKYRFRNFFSEKLNRRSKVEIFAWHRHIKNLNFRSTVELFEKKVAKPIFLDCPRCCKRKKVRNFSHPTNTRGSGCTSVILPKIMELQLNTNHRSVASPHLSSLKRGEYFSLG